MTTAITTAIMPTTISPQPAAGQDPLEALISTFVRTNRCGECGLIGPAHSCPQCGIRFCATDLMAHHVIHKQDDFTDRLVAALRQTPAGIVSACSVNGASLTPNGAFPQGGPQPLAFELARHYGAAAAIVNIYRPRSPEAVQGIADAVSRMLERAGATPWQFYRTETGAAFVIIPNEETGRIPDLYIKPGVPPGKVSKRIRNALGPANYTRVWESTAYRGDTPTRYRLRPPGMARPLQVRVIRTRRDAGDGMGVIRWSSWQALAAEAGLNPATYDHAYAVWALMPHGAQQPAYAKAMLVPVPEQRMTELYGDADIAIDSKSVNDHIGIPGTNTLRVDFRRLPSHRFHMLESMMHGVQVAATLDLDEVLAVARNIIARERREPVADLLADYWRHPEPDPETPAEDSIKAIADRILQRGSANECSLLQRSTELAAYAAGGPFGHPSVMRQFSDPITGPLSHKATGWKAHPTVPVAQTELIHVCPQLLGSPIPKRGYTKVMEHPMAGTPAFGHTGPWGIAFNPHDLADKPEELDGADCDTDKLYAIALHGPDERPYLMANRLPASIGAGKPKRLTLKNAAWLRQLGIHFYRQVGEPPFTDSLGLPDQLTATALPELAEYPPPTDPWQFLYGGAPKGIMGGICLLMWILVRSGGYSPAIHKLNFSEQVIDRMHNGDGDPTRIQTALEDALLDHICAGRTVEPCYLHRVKDGLELRFRQRQLDAGVPEDELANLKPLLQSQHNDWCDPLSETRKRLLAETGYATETRSRMTAGPGGRLTMPITDPVWNVAASAVQFWNTCWNNTFQDMAALSRALWGKESDHRIPWTQLSAAGSRYLRQRAGIRRDTDLTWEINDQLATELKQLASRQTERRIRNAYAKALDAGAQAGEFASALCQAQHARAKHANRPTVVNPGRMLEHLPASELEGHYFGAPLHPTVVIMPRQSGSVNYAVYRDGEPVFGRGSAALRRKLEDEDPEVAQALADALPGDKVRVDLETGCGVTSVRHYRNGQAEKVTQMVAKAALQPGAVYRIAASGNGRQVRLFDAEGVQVLELQADAKRFCGMNLLYAGQIPARSHGPGGYQAAVSPLVFELAAESILLTVPLPADQA